MPEFVVQCITRAPPATAVTVADGYHNPVLEYAIMGPLSLLADSSPALPCPDFPATGASPAEHLAWCLRFGGFCTRQAQLAREFNLPPHKWLRAAELAAFAASIWSERAQGIAP